jgi:hypothetical protein
MKRRGFIKRKKSPSLSFSYHLTLHVVGTSDTAEVKKRLQELLTQLASRRDKGCCVSNPTTGACGGYTKAGEFIFQAEHLITRWPLA